MLHWATRLRVAAHCRWQDVASVAGAGACAAGGAFMFAGAVRVPARIHGCTLGGNFEFVKGRKSVICGVWAAPGAPETPLPKGGGLLPRPPKQPISDHSIIIVF